MEEKWKKISGLENFYEVSNKGRIRSLDRKLKDGRFWKGRIMKTPLSAGYPSVSLRTPENNYLNQRVHRLVAQEFLIKIKNKTLVNHIDGNKLNNCVENLEWCNSKENSIHAFKTGLTVNNIKKAHKINKKQIVQLSHNLEFIKIHNSAKDAANEIGIAPQGITRAARGERKSAGGYKWIYKKNYNTD
jgi:hypothetical protein